MCLRVLRDAIVSRATASESAMVKVINSLIWGALIFTLKKLNFKNKRRALIRNNLATPKGSKLFKLHN